VPGGSAYSNNLLRSYRGLSNISAQLTQFWDTYHSIQTSLNRRYRNGLAFGVNYTLGLSLTGNTGLQSRFQHAADGTISLRSDQAAYEALNNNLALQKHVIKGYAVWSLPKVPSALGSVAGVFLNDWQISGVVTAGSAQNSTNNTNGRYDLTYTYQNNGAAVNLTGSPDYAARIVYTGNPGSGCSSNQYAQFNTASVTGPTYGSVGLESGRYILGGCWDHVVDLALVKNFIFTSTKTLQFRVDAFNVFNTVVYNDRNFTVQYRSPTDLTILNSQYLPNGQVDPTRLTPRTAGFGAATNAESLRTLQLELRFGF
jgi:hypothetical protein